MVLTEVWRTHVPIEVLGLNIENTWARIASTALTISLFKGAVGRAVNQISLKKFQSCELQAPDAMI